MTSRDGFDRPIGVLLDELAAPRIPEYLDEILARTGRTRQRQAWMSPGRWLPMQTTLRFSAVPRSAWLLLILVLVTLAVAASAALLIGGRHSLPPPFGFARTGLLTFDAGGDIYVANVDGSGRRAIVSDPAEDVGPTWSPDGTMIAFWSVPAGTTWASDADTAVARLIVVDADGRNQRTLATDAIIGPPGWASISWSPDSSRVAYADYHASMVSIARVDESPAIKVGAPGIAALTPQWSPDGKTIAFEEQGGPLPGLYLMTADGSNIHRLTNVAPGGTGLQWSPLGNQLVFYANDSSAGHDIWVIGADGSGERDITKDATDDFWPTWSPDGMHIAFESGTGSDDLFVIAPDGSGRRKLNAVVTGAPPVWAPDGTTLYCFAFANAVEIVDVADKAAVVSIPADGNLGNGNWQRLAP